MSLVWGYAVFRYGGVLPEDWNLCLVALGVIGVVYWLKTPQMEVAPRLERRYRWVIGLWLGYVAFQLVPLPLGVLRILSPQRVAAVEALGPVEGFVGFASLSVVPAVTLEHGLRIAAYTVLFLLVREIAWRLSDRPWTVIFPIVVVAGLEGSLGLAQHLMGDPNRGVAGTYVNRNHFAGLLEMSLPFAVVFPAVIVQRARSRWLSPVRPAVKACAMIAVAGVTFVGIVVSYSRMGFVAALVSLFVVGGLAFATAPGLRRRGLVAVLVAGLVVLVFVFLPSDAFIKRYARVATLEAFMAEDRVPLWVETLDLIRAYPLVGCGLGGYESAFLRYQESWPPVNAPYAHNDYLQLLAELGGIGFAIAAALMLVLLARAVRVATAHSKPNSRYLALACTGSMAAISIHSLADFNLYIPANAMLVAWVCGIGTSLEFRSRR